MSVSGSYEIKKRKDLNEREKSMVIHMSEVAKSTSDHMMSEVRRMGYSDAGDVISITSNVVMMMILNLGLVFPEALGREIIDGIRDGIDKMIDNIDSNDFAKEEVGQDGH